MEVVDVPPGVLEVRETNYCRLFAAHDEHTGKVLAFSAIDNLWKGTSSQALQNLNLMFGLPETRGLLDPGELRGAGMSVFGSRWVHAPEHVRELPADAGLPAGFRAAGVAAGLKPSGDPDVGLLVCDAEQPPRRRSSRARARQPRRSWSRAIAAACRRCGRYSPTRAARTPPPAGGDSTTPPRRRAQPPPRPRFGVRGGARLDRRDQPLPGRERDPEGDPRGPLAASPRGRRRLPAGDPDDRPLREARQPRGAAALRAACACAPSARARA